MRPSQPSSLNCRYEVLKHGDQQAREEKVEGYEQRLLVHEVEQQTVPGRALTDHAKSTKGWL